MLSTGPAPVFERTSLWPLVAAGVVSAIVALGLVALLLVTLLLVAFCAYGLSRARHMRRNTVERVSHGLEHACIAILQRFGHHPTEGRTKNNTFVVGIKATERGTNAAVRHAAEEAIRRVLAGQRELAYTPNCGTSVMTRALLTAIAISGALVAFLANGFTIPTLLGAAGGYVVARLLAYPLGLLIQHTMTVSTEFTSARVVNVERIESEKKKVLFQVDLEVIA